MGRHTAPIPIIPTGVPRPTATTTVTDPNLFDRPIASSTPVRRRERVTSRLRQPQTRPAWASDVGDDDAIDEMLVAVERRSARDVLDAQDRAAAAEAPPARLPRVRDVAFTICALAVLGVAVSAALLP